MDEHSTDTATGESAAPEAAPAESNVDDLPDWARAALKKANAEAASYRTKVRELEPLAKKARDLEDASKTETEKAAERLTAAERRAQEAELRALRLEVAAEKGLTPAQARRLVGTSKEELEADADELLDTFAPGGDDGTKPRTPSRPAERLRPLRSGATAEDTPADGNDWFRRFVGAD